MRNYFVKYRKHSIEPEEIFLDSASSKEKEPLERLEFAVPSSYTRFVVGFSLAVLFVMLSFSFYYQVIQGNVWTKRAEENALRVLFSEAPRGLLFDRYGKPLVENQVIFDLTAFPLELPKGGASLQSEASIMGQTLNVPQDQIFTRLKTIQKQNLAEPQILFPDISQQNALVLTARASDLPGIKLSGHFQRVYPWGSALSTILGYTGLATPQDVKADPSLNLKDIVGKAGLESYYDKLLRGKKGEAQYEVNSQLQVTNQRTVNGPTLGENLRLTIDAEFQRYLYTIMNDFIGTKYGGGAAVAIDPRTGGIIALTTVPSYDDNLFSRGIAQQEFQALVRSRQKSLFDRAISGEYSSGSTVKPFIALAAMEEHSIDPATRIPGGGGELVVPNPYDPTKPTIFHDWTSHDPLNMIDAIAQSDDVYFYIVGGGFRGNVGNDFVNQVGLGVERIKKYLSYFGWGKPLGIDLLGEGTGLLPDPAWKAAHDPNNPTWRIGDTYNLSIGQGDLLVTPLQLTDTYAIFANGGTLYKPYLLQAVEDPGTNKMLQSVSSQIIKRFSFTAQELNVIREGLRLTVAAGSARRLSDLPFEVAGKTGTAQVSASLEKTNAIFVSYIPINNPQIVLTILVEGGGEGGATAVPIARQALTWYWENRILSTPQPSS